MNQWERPLASELESDELPLQAPSQSPAPDARKPYVIPTLMEPQDMLETTKFFFQVGGGGSGTG